MEEKSGHSEINKYRQTLQVVTDRLFNYTLYIYELLTVRKQKRNVIITLLDTIK